MNRQLTLMVITFFSPLVTSASQEPLSQYFLHLRKLEFTEARRIAANASDIRLRLEMSQLADLLFYEGQISKDVFTIPKLESGSNPAQVILNDLTSGYMSLFYDQVKGKAFKHFYNAYVIARETGDPYLIKACLLALLKYHNFEIAQNSESYLPYLRHLEEIQDNPTDRAWVAIYKMIFYSKTQENLDDEYFKLSASLDHLASELDSGSPLLTFVFYEKALASDIARKQTDAILFYKKAIERAGNFPYLRYHRFFSSLKLMMIETEGKKFDSARYFLGVARKSVNKADTLRSDFYLNYYQSFLLHAQNKNDSAFALLSKAYVQGFKLDFRKNTLEINRLNVELNTQEKENANLQLKQDRTWLISALVASALLMAAGYFAFANQRAKSKMQLQEKEVQAMKLEKQMKEQEMHGIDLMIEGQEKERQRIANDLHDDLGGQLAAVKIKLEEMEKQLHLENDQNELLQETTSLLNEAYLKVRSMAHARNAGINAQEGLLPAVRNFASKVSIANRLAIEVEEHGMDTRLENSLEITIFRVIQELITNVIKHAQASEVTIHLTQHEDLINVMVEDNGMGFDITKIKPADTMGLHSIQKRIENLGGEVTIDSVAQKGTTVIIDIPYHDQVGNS